MVCQLEVKPEVTLYALQLGKKHGGVCVCVLVLVLVPMEIDTLSLGTVAH